MRAITATIRSCGSSAHRFSSGDRSAQPSGAKAAQRLLVPAVINAPHSPATSGTRRPDASFLAQLIAAHQNAPQARERRRAEPAAAIAAYAAVAALG